jgi:hypothetical protein
VLQVTLQGVTVAERSAVGPIVRVGALGCRRVIGRSEIAIDGPRYFCQQLPGVGGERRSSGGGLRRVSIDLMT